MPSTSRAALAAMTLAALAAMSGSARAGIVVDYAVVGMHPDGTAYPEIIGPPDGRTAGDPWTTTKFISRARYDTLASALGMTEAELGSYQLIAWEDNGGGPAASGGWESAEWVFQAGGLRLATRFDEISGASSDPAVVFRTGSISGTVYDDLFGTAGASPVMSFLLARLPAAIDTRNPGFSVSFAPGGPSAGGLGQGTPDPDAIGLLSTVPEPGTPALVVAALVALARRCRGRRSASTPA